MKVCTFQHAMPFNRTIICLSRLQNNNFSNLAPLIFTDHFCTDLSLCLIPRRKGFKRSGLGTAEILQWAPKGSRKLRTNVRTQKIISSLSYLYSSFLWRCVNRIWLCGEFLSRERERDREWEWEWEWEGEREPCTYRSLFVPTYSSKSTSLLSALIVLASWALNSLFAHNSYSVICFYFCFYAFVWLCWGCVIFGTLLASSNPCMKIWG